MLAVGDWSRALTAEQLERARAAVIVRDFAAGPTSAARASRR